MPLAVATLEELDKLQGLKARGVILERQYEVIKKHIMEGNSLTNENWKAFELAWKLKTNGGFSEEEWTTQIDGDISVIVNSARPSLSSQHASTPSALGKRPAAAAAAASAVRGAPNRGKNKKTEAAQGSRNIINAFAFGSGKPVSSSRQTLHT